MVAFDYALRKDPLTGVDRECGDEGIILEREGSLFVALLDALGHGEEAWDVSNRAKEYILEHQEEELPLILKGLNEFMQRTRGLVAALCLIDGESGTVRFSGIGNISTRIHGKNSFTFIPREGIVGYLMPSPREQEAKFDWHDTLVLNSDGVKEHLPLLEQPDLLSGTAEEIAEKLITRMRNHDDASCLVVRCRKCIN
ncbi:MAG: SpoIIE family protein phosphatase [Spirochaetales bacterium]|nr:SpoIIE family protein phosphatase [Spirochaetales bacterium]